MDFFRRQQWNIVGHIWVWYGISLVLILAGLGTVVIKGMNYGIDFTGGSLLKFQFDQPLVSGDIPAAQVIGKARAMLQQHGLAKSQIQVAGGNQLLIRTPQAEEAEAAQQQQQIQQSLQELFGQQAGTVSAVGRDMVGPVVGAHLRNAAILALILGSILILIYIAIRYEFVFGVAGVVALIHDVLIVIGVMALLQVELNTEFVAAILTMVGYSVNDSVVIFDRIRENMRLHRGREFASIVNASLLQTMTRSINTSMTTLLGLIAIFFFGGPAIHAFALALIVGVATGTYSSIFIAAPLVVLWQKRRRAAAPVVARRPAAVAAGGGGGKSVAAEPTPSSETSQVDEVIERTQRQTQEEKREQRRKRRKSKRDKGSRKRF